MAVSEHALSQTMFSPTTTTATATATATAEMEEDEHVTRRRQIIECHQQMDFWAKKLKILLHQQDRYFKLAKLRLDASTNWNRLSPNEKNDKEFILAALKSKKLPHALKHFDEAVLPLNIRSDRDIFMARLHRESFAREFRESNMIVPPPLCDEKEIMLEVITRQPHAVEFMPDVWRGDKDFLRAVLSVEHPPRDYLKHFSELLRSDADLMIEVFGNAKTEMSMMKYCSIDLRDNKDFFIQMSERHLIESKEKGIYHNFYMAKNQVLQYASIRLRDDSDVVMSCIRQCAMNLQYASDDIRRNKEIVTKAGLDDGDALLFYKSNLIEDGLLDQKRLAESIVCSDHAPIEVLRHCIKLHGDDKEIVYLSLKNPNMEWSLVPESLLYDVEFLIDATCVCDGGDIWCSLPEKMKGNFEVAYAIVTMPIKKKELLPEILNACPALLSDRHAIKNMISWHWQDFSLMERILECSTIGIHHDKDILMHMIEQCPMFVQDCPEELRHDKDIVIAVADSCNGDLRLVPDEYKVENPEVVVRAIEKFSSELDTLELGISRDLWQDRNIALSWLASGGAWKWDFPHHYSDDEEMILASLKNHWHSFYHVSESLRRNKAFVIKALAVDARITIHYLDEDTLHDDEVALEAISRDERAIESYEGVRSILFLTAFVERTKQKLKEYQIFQDEVVALMKKSSQKKELNTLSMLNQGSVMLSSYEKKIASYVGVIEDQDLAKYKAACSHLAAWGF